MPDADERHPLSSSESSPHTPEYIFVVFMFMVWSSIYDVLTKREGVKDIPNLRTNSIKILWAGGKKSKTFVDFLYRSLL